MKKIYRNILVLSFVATTSFSLFGQSSVKFPVPSPSQAIKQSFAIGEVSVEYNRPSANGRVVFGELVPYGKIWRTGANGSTKITFSHDVKIQGNEVKKGTYALFSIPNKDSWNIMLTTNLTIGGNVDKYSTSEEVLNIKIPVITIADKRETFSIDFDQIKNTSMVMNLSWENVKISLNIETNIDTMIMNDISSAMAKDTRPYYQAATYYYENDKDLNQALVWVNEAVKQNPNAFWIYMLKAKIQFKLNDGEGAIVSANKVIELAKQTSYTNYVTQAEELIVEAKKMPKTKKK